MSDDSSNHADDRIVTSEQWDRLTRLRSPSSYPEEQVQEFVRKLDQNALFHSHYYAEALSRASTQVAIVPPSSTSNPDVAPSLALTTNWNFSHSICSTPFVLPNPLPTVPRPIGLADDRPYTFDEWKNREGEKLRQKRELTVEASVNITTRPSEADVFWDKSTGAAATKDEIKQIKKEETELLDFILDIAPTDPDAQKRHLKLVTFVKASHQGWSLFEYCVARLVRGEWRESRFFVSPDHWKARCRIQYILDQARGILGARQVGRQQGGGKKEKKNSTTQSDQRDKLPTPPPPFSIPQVEVIVRQLQTLPLFSSIDLSTYALLDDSQPTISGSAHQHVSAGVTQGGKLMEFAFSDRVDWRFMMAEVKTDKRIFASHAAVLDQIALLLAYSKFRVPPGAGSKDFAAATHKVTRCLDESAFESLADDRTQDNDMPDAFDDLRVLMSDNESTEWDDVAGSAGLTFMIRLTLNAIGVQRRISRLLGSDEEEHSAFVEANILPELLSFVHRLLHRNQLTESTSSNSALVPAPGCGAHGLGGVDNGDHGVNGLNGGGERGDARADETGAIEGSQNEGGAASTAGKRNAESTTEPPKAKKQRTNKGLTATRHSVAPSELERLLLEQPAPKPRTLFARLEKLKLLPSAWTSAEVIEKLLPADVRREFIGIMARPQGSTEGGESA